jgi:malonyl-CoA O-methyltransferase
MNSLTQPAAIMGGVPTSNANRLSIARAFARGAATYDTFAELQRQVADRLLAQLPSIEASACVLDLGCGTGYCTQQLQARAPATLLALDLALPMLSATAQRCGASNNLQLIGGDAQTLPLHNDSVDWIVSSLTLQWCSDITKVFAELGRVLRPGGRVLLSTLGPQTLQELRAAWAGVDNRQHSNGFVPASALQAAAGAANLQVSLHAELKIRHYPSLRALAMELKGLGANAVASAVSPGVTAPSAFQAASAAFAQHGDTAGIPVSWEIYYLQLQKPE